MTKVQILQCWPYVKHPRRQQKGIKYRLHMPNPKEFMAYYSQAKEKKKKTSVAR